MKLSDRLLGVLFMLLGVGVLAYGAALPPMPGQAYGAGLFPLVVGGFLGLGGCALALSGWQRRGTEAVFSRADWLRSREHVVNALLTLGAILAFALLMRPLGFAVLAFATVAVLLVRFGVRWWKAGIAALLGATAFQILFVSLMRVPLPPGLLDGLIR